MRRDHLRLTSPDASLPTAIVAAGARLAVDQTITSAALSSSLPAELREEFPTNLPPLIEPSRVSDLEPSITVAADLACVSCIPPLLALEPLDGGNEPRCNKLAESLSAPPLLPGDHSLVAAMHSGIILNAMHSGIVLKHLSEAARLIVKAFRLFMPVMQAQLHRAWRRRCLVIVRQTDSALSLIHI